MEIHAYEVHDGFSIRWVDSELKFLLKADGWNWDKVGMLVSLMQRVAV